MRDRLLLHYLESHVEGWSCGRHLGEIGWKIFLFGQVFLLNLSYVYLAT